MTITYTSGDTRTIGTSAYTFSIFIDGAQGTAEQIYEFVQWAFNYILIIESQLNNFPFF